MTWGLNDTYSAFLNTLRCNQTYMQKNVDAMTFIHKKLN